MKKLFNKKFALILGSTITLLLVLTVAMIFLTKENTKTFTRSGYIIASNKEDSTKYYFDKGTSYKKNINSELVFTDTSGEKVNVETDNFLHYIDGGMKFLKNGVIMDLDSVNETIVPYYNITNKSLLEYSKKSYYIETVDKTLAFNNLIGRISENKYIVAGVDIRLQLAGNDKEITGDYFEITFIEDGIIKVENQEFSYQTTAENSYVFSGENIKIDLGQKKVYYNDEEKMSLTQMTIDGNENIEIIPNEEKEDNGSTENDNGENNQNPPQNNQEPNNEQGNNNEQNDGTAGSSGNNSGKQERKASIEIVEAEVGVNNISGKFYINDPDNTIKGDLVLHITNTDTGKRVYSIGVDKTQKEFNFGSETLSPNKNYILSINEETNEEYDTQYFQKLFKTDTLGISLEKKYVTSNSIAYEVRFDDDTEVKSVRINLNDTEYKEVATPVIVDKENNLAVFENLKNNTTYNIVLDNVILGNTEYNEVYTMYKTIKTLKQTPSISGLKAEINEDENQFTLSIDNITDLDKSITKYYYHIYNADEMTTENRETIEPVKIIEQENTDKITLKIDNETIKPKTNYIFKVVAEYYDNEKYSEYETTFSDNFILAGRPTVKFERNENETDANTIVGKIIIADENCTLPLNGRSCYKEPDNNNVFEIKISEKTANGLKFIKEQEITIDNFDDKKLESNIVIDTEIDKPLYANTEYEIEIYASMNLHDGQGTRKDVRIGSFVTSTTGAEILKVENWLPKESTRDNLIQVEPKIISGSNEINNKFNSVYHLEFNLYAEDVREKILNNKDVTPMATTTVSGNNLKDSYFEQYFLIDTLNRFEITEGKISTEEGIKNVSAFEMLKYKSGGELLKNYTIEIKAYDETKQIPIKIENNLYLFETPGMIMLEEQLLKPTIIADHIEKQMLTQEELKNIYEDNDYLDKLNASTIVGYKVTVVADINKISTYFAGNPVKEIIYYVCDANINKNCTIENAITTRTINLSEDSSLETTFYLEESTSYAIEDKTLTRGHNYIFKAKFNIDTNNDAIADTLYPTIQTVETGIKETPKQDLEYSIYIDKTESDKVYYNYTIKDIDQTLIDNKFHYTVDNGEEQTFDFSTSDSFVIENLSNDSVYKIALNKALIKNSNYIENLTVGTYIFDGNYVYNTNDIKFENVIYKNDNRLRILILADENILNRVAAYNIKLTANDVDTYEKMYGSNELEKCPYNDTEYNCIIVDYSDIRDFKSKTTSLEVKAYYDSGIINNDFGNIGKSSENKNNKSKGYILQSNNIYNPDKIKGNYIYIDTVNKYPEGKVKTSEKPIGIYYFLSGSKNYIEIENQLNKKYISANLEYAQDNIMFSVGSFNSSINNKLLNTTNLSYDDNTFKFESYIPKIEVESRKLVNGAVVTITSSGLAQEDIEEDFKQEDGKYYYYLRIYDNQEKTGTYQEKKLEIKPNNEPSSIRLEGYAGTHYFEVYAKMKKEENTFEETLIFDSSFSNEYKSTTYEFSSFSKEELQAITGLSHTVSAGENGKYMKRNINLEIEVDPVDNKINYTDIGEYKVRFELTDKTGIKWQGEMEKTDDKKDNEFTFNKDITDDNFIFGVSGYYNLKVYVSFELYNGEPYEICIKEIGAGLEALKDLQYGLDVSNATKDSITINPTIVDPSRAIIDGKYCIQLLLNNEVVKEQCDLSVNEKAEGITFYDLEPPNTTYLVRVYGNMYTTGENEEGKTATKVFEMITTASTTTEDNVALGSIYTKLDSKTKKITLKYDGSYGLDKIIQINYTLYKNKKDEVKSGTYYMQDYNGYQQNKRFVWDDKDKSYTLEIDLGSDVTIDNNVEYLLNISYHIINEEKPGELKQLDYKTYSHAIIASSN